LCTGKVPSGPHVVGPATWQESTVQSPTPSGATQTFETAGQVSQGPIVQSLSCAQVAPRPPEALLDEELADEELAEDALLDEELLEDALLDEELAEEELVDELAEEALVEAVPPVPPPEVVDALPPVPPEELADEGLLDEEPALELALVAPWPAPPAPPPPLPDVLAHPSAGATQTSSATARCSRERMSIRGTSAVWVTRTRAAIHRRPASRVTLRWPEGRARCPSATASP
jgi:hypothetical protein